MTIDAETDLLKIIAKRSLPLCPARQTSDGQSELTLGHCEMTNLTKTVADRRPWQVGHVVDALGLPVGRLNN
jgi:hypothetical protein